MAAGKEIKKKIISVKSTQKITSAMQMVAASKMRRTQERMRQGKPYAEKIRSVIGHLANANPEYRHIYMGERDIKRIGYIVVSTDKGLCGGLNVNMFRVVLRDMQQWHGESVDIEFCLIGNKAASFFRAYGGNVPAMLQQASAKCRAMSELIGGPGDARRLQRRADRPVVHGEQRVRQHDDAKAR